MHAHEEVPSLLSSYMGFDRKQLLIFSALVVGVIVVVTLLYVMIFGFRTWSNNMQQAGHLLLANVNPSLQAVQPIPLPPIPLSPPCPQPAAGFGIQFACPQCGIVGLPRWTVGGTPQCPTCGGIMTPGARPAQAAFAARP